MAKAKTAKKNRWIAPTVAVTALLAVVLLLFLLLQQLRQEPTPGPQTTQSLPQTMPQSPYSPTDFTEEGGYLSCLGTESMVGIDVSHHQQQVDWQQVADAGIRFVMVRLGYRGISDGTLHADTYVQENLTGARDAGLLVGAYFYSQATTAEEAEQEARFALEILGDFSLDLPLAYDWEIESRTEPVDVSTATQCAITFCGIVEAAGQEAMIYFNSYQAAQRLDLLQLTAYPWWLAMYDPQGEFPCRFDMWQYTSAGAVPGIRGDVDINVLLMP